ncbi:MAG: TonB-dependent receptor [Verrucomicrobiota bacterium]
MNEEKLNTDQKALQINIDKLKYGTFAEIGAGQEVARWFFRVGGAAGTVAKTISAYDMTVSDAIYGPADRYVSRQRLQAMLTHEYNLVLERLDKTRGDKTAFFAFANTVTTRSYTRKDEGQGWMGIRFQGAPRQRPSEIIVHVRLLDPEPVREQEALGVVGVNLAHAAFYQHTSPINLIIALLDGLSRERVEVDMIKFSGPCFAGVDNRLMTLQLVEKGLTDAAMFTADGEAVIPGEMLYKKPVLVERGSFRPLTTPMLEMLERAQEQFVQEKALADEAPVTLLEMTLKQLQVGDVIDHGDFLDRVDTLRALNRPVLISNFRRYHRLVQFLSRHTSKMIGLPLGLVRLRDVLDEKNYTDLGGGLMESLGQLFRAGVKLYVYPWLNRETGQVITLENFQPAEPIKHLYAHLLANGFIEPIRKFNPDYLAVSSGGVMEKLQQGDVAWETQVPAPIAEVIKTKKLFGCP